MPYGGNDWLALTQEPTLEPEIPICDPHHHFWDFRSERIPYQRYLLHELAADMNCGFVKGFGLERGALASSVGHDSHNLCVLGASDEDMALAVNRVIELAGGFVAVRDGQVIAELPLPIAGLMSGGSAEMVRPAVATLRDAVRAMGCPLAGPLLQLSFLSLPVIPHLKITDRGLVDVDRFELIDP